MDKFEVDKPEVDKPEAAIRVVFDVKIKKLVDNAVIPSYAHPGDAGMDITCTSIEYDDKNDCIMYHTGLAFEVPKGYVMLIFPRSSNRKTNFYLANHVGVLDSKKPIFS